MTAKQQRWFNISLWPEACRAQGWKQTDRALKLRVVGEIIGRQITTTKEVEPKQEFNRVKDRLEALAHSGRDLSVPTGKSRGTEAAPTFKRRGACSQSTLDMLEDYFERALRVHCRQHDLLPALDEAAIESLRTEWTTEALGHGQDWEILTPPQVDRLKPFLIWQANPDSEAAAAAFRTATLDGQTRRIIAVIVKRATQLRQIEALLKPAEGASLLTDEAIEGYIASVAADVNLHRNWRGLLLPLLEDQLLLTIEERTREWERLFKFVYGEGVWEQLAWVLQHRPELYNDLAGKILALPCWMTLDHARQLRAEQRAEKRKQQQNDRATQRHGDTEISASPRPSVSASSPEADPFTTGETPF
jgi:hypothetical protein